MSNSTLCPAPFLAADAFPATGGCESTAQGHQQPNGSTPALISNNFKDTSMVANWINVVGMVCCLFLLLSWAFLPVDKTHRHYLSISLTCAVSLMNLGFIIPLAAKPEQCFNEITPNGMDSSSVCAASGAFLLGGGWAGVMWVFLRSLSLHLQICWQMVVGRSFMWLSQALGWGIPIIGVIILMLLSGVSFRFGQTCHINHQNSLGDFWIPLLVFAGLTVIIQFATFGYCIKVYLASLADSSSTTEGSSLPAYSASIRTMTPRQAYRRVRRVIQLQWRGIVIVLIIIADVIFFAVIFVFQDNTVESVKNNPQKAGPWLICILANQGDKNKCLEEALEVVVPLPTVMAVLILLAINGIWLLFLMGRWTMVTGWRDYFLSMTGNRTKKEFVSVDARLEDVKTEPRSYEMLSRDSGKAESILTPISPSKSPMSPRSGRHTPDYFSQAPRYQPHSRSFSAPRPPTQQQEQPMFSWDAQEQQPQVQQLPPRSPPRNPSYSRPVPPEGYVDPLGMNRL